MREVVIVEAGRSPVGKRGGSLSQVHPVDTLGAVQQEVLRRANVESSHVGQVIGGCINKVGAQAMNITRTAWLSHGGSQEVGCVTVDSQCGSSQYSVNLAHALISSGQEDIVMACGVENMSRLPIASDAEAGDRAGMGHPLTRSYRNYFEFISQFEGAERIALKYGISRAEIDDFGLASQLKAAAAISGGYFDTQLIPLEVDVFDESGERTGAKTRASKDEVPRHTSLEKLAALKPVAGPDGLHTAGTSSQISDGASAVLLMSAEAAERHGLDPRAKVVETALVGCDPVLMLEGPIPATEKILKTQGLSIDDIDVFEINEAFASVVLAWAKAVGADIDAVNPNGGAIALGHPLGATGSILVTKALHELERTEGRFALIGMCCGGGLGTGTLIERLR
ncbi:MAG TPA: acetyl-CoA C-acyltransferase [Acidimicrobiales bacterium]|jgi:acetyl-CoA C-acetyltransferase|nr:acetyl-CoA C-acyltransferase [Acidimicrobiales bacterium]